MLLGITGFEIRYQLRNPVFWVAFLFFFLLGFGLTASANVSLGTPGAVHENAPSAVAIAMAAFGMFYLFVTTAFVANAIVRDDSTGFGPMVRASAVTKTDLVLGRFAGGLIISLLGYLSVPLGLAVGASMPWVDPETVGSMGIANYAWHYLIIALPNIFVASAFLMALATTFRSMMATYIGLIVFLIGYTFTNVIIGSMPEYLPTFAKFELLGLAAVQDMTRYWTTAELNSRLLPLTGNLLFNRVLVVALGAAILAATVWRFSMSERAPSKRKLRRLAKKQAAEAKLAQDRPTLLKGNIRPSYGPATSFAQLRARTGSEVMQVLKSPGLIVILILAIFNTAGELLTTRTQYGTPSYPLTANVISTVDQGFALFLLMIAIFYGGELVWRERDRKFHEIIDSTPVADWIMIVPKILALMCVMMLVNMAGVLTGMAVQLFRHSTDLALNEYLLWFVIPSTIGAMLLAVLAVFFQVISPNKYVGWGLMVVWFVVGIFLRNMGYENELYRYASIPPEPLSDMNGTGGFWVGAAWLRFYWICFAAILLVFAHLVWPRGTVTAFLPRLRGAGRRISVGPATIAAVSLVGMILSGFYIYDNIKRKNIYWTDDDFEKYQADLEKKYLKFEKLPQPNVVDVKIDAHVYPKQLRLNVAGVETLRNDTGKPISDIHVRRGSMYTKFPKIEITGARLASRDDRFDYRIFRLDKPLAPGASVTMTWTAQIHYDGFRHGRPLTDVARNGTFVNNTDFAPIIGMDRNGLLRDRTERRRQGLAPELRPTKLEDMSATRKNYVGVDWVNTDITVTTDADQVPIAPGRTVADTSAGGRRTMRFVSDAPILDFFNIQSARYAIAREKHAGVDLAVYYHPAHKWNVPRMLKAMATALDYYQANFGPYQFKQARIVEFPGYAGFAQAFANTMPYSESIGFAANVSDPETIDYVTYVTAHEFGHQYWAHQVIGADMQGATVTTETMAQYSALMVMKKIYGPDKIRRFLKYELDDYLSSRQGEAVEELPLYRVENQPYIHYRKGAVVLYLLQERLGEAAVNRALARFIAKYKFKGAPYHRSVDLIAELRKEATTPEQQALITDLFEKITVYDLKAKSAVTKKTADGQWLTTITVEAKKFYADGKGVEKQAPLSEAIEIGLFSARPGLAAFDSKDVIVMQRQPIRGGAQVITVKSKRKPTVAGIDPYNFYIDRNSDDNVVDVTG